MRTDTGTITFIILGGFVLGILALFATKRHGKKDIFAKAVAGTAINGALILLSLLLRPGLIKAAERARQMRQRHAGKEAAVANESE